MALKREYKPGCRLEYFELDGLLNRLRREVDEHGEDGEVSTPYYKGAEIAVSIIRYHEFLDTQEDFMRLFERALDDLEGGE